MPIGSMRLLIRAEWVVVRELSKKRRLPCAIFADSARGRRDALRSDRLSAVPPKVVQELRTKTDNRSFPCGKGSGCAPERRRPVSKRLGAESAKTAGAEISQFPAIESG